MNRFRTYRSRARHGVTCQWVLSLGPPPEARIIMRRNVVTPLLKRRHDVGYEAYCIHRDPNAQELGDVAYPSIVQLEMSQLLIIQIRRECASQPPVSFCVDLSLASRPLDSAPQTTRACKPSRPYQTLSVASLKAQGYRICEFRSSLGLYVNRPILF